MRLPWGTVSKCGPIAQLNCYDYWMSASAPATLPLFDNAQAWYGPEMARQDKWSRTLDEANLAEIDAAIRHALSRRIGPAALRKEDFPLPGLAETLDEVRRELLFGRGFFLLRGMPVERYSPLEAALAYLGIGSHLGEAVSQNGKGHILGHVKNLNLDIRDPEVRFYQTNALLEFHSDFSDLVGLLCLRTSRTGGASSIVSSTTVWNEMVKRRPDIAEAMLGPIYYTRAGEVAPGMKRYSEMPAFTPWGGRMIAFYRSRTTAGKAQALPEVPRLTPKQREGMDFVEHLASDPGLRMDMDFRPGDIQLLCNHYVLHSRSAYEEWPEPDRRRHLLRLWLACADGPEIPPFMLADGRTSAGRPNGILIPGMPLRAPLDAE